MELEHQIPLVFFKLATGPEDDGLDLSLIEEAKDWAPGSEEERVGYGALESEKGGLGLREEAGACAVCRVCSVCLSLSCLFSPLLSC